MTTARTTYPARAAIAIRRANDHAGRSSRARAGIRQLARSSREICGGGGAPRDLNHVQAPPATRTTAAIEPRITSSVVTSIEGATVETTRTAESTIIVLTIRPATAFSHGRLTHGPSTARSLHSRTAKTVVLGSMIPASAWTAVVMRPSGAYGMSTMAAASATMPV